MSLIFIMIFTQGLLFLRRGAIMKRKQTRIGLRSARNKLILERIQSDMTDMSGL
jgi:hypothetical protein